MRSLKIIASAATLAILSLAGCGGGGGDSSSSSIPTALLPSTTTPNGGAVQPAVPASAPAPAPAEKRVVTLTVGSSSFSGMKTIQAVNNVAASAPLAASAPAATVPLPTTSAGMITASPINQVFHLNRSADGLSFYGWSDVAGTYLIPVADLKMVCANGFQTGLSIMGNTSRACAAPDLVANTVTLPGTCSRDVNFYTAFLGAMVVNRCTRTSQVNASSQPTRLVCLA